MAAGVLLGSPLTASCTSSAEHPNGASDVTGGFDWRKASGQKIKVLQTPHTYQRSFEPILKDFTELTGVEVETDLVPEGDYFGQLTVELQDGSGEHDAFMIGAYFLWQYGPRRWLEDLRPWLESSSTTSTEFDFTDIFEGLRTATAWDFQVGSPLGTGGQWAIPWGFETNVIAYDKALFDARGIRPAETFDDLIQLAADLTDRGAGRYGISFRGSQSWATVHPGFMTQFSRSGARDYETAGGRLTARMNSPEAVDFTRKWVHLAQAGGPLAWPTYEYPDCARDLGAGSAAMVYDADAVTYALNKPGASARAGQLAWHPGPAGPGGHSTNLWTWAYAMNAASKRKLAAWLFIQWATGKEALSAAIRGGAFADPVRKSVFDGAFKQTLGGFPGYLETFETVLPQTKIQFTPHTSFFETTEDWALALRDIYDGHDAQTRLDALARTSTAKVAAGGS